MNCYLISYDLANNRDYVSLFRAIKSYGTWAHITESNWAVVTTKSALEVRNHLANVLDSDDSLIVVRSGSEAAWQKVSCSNDWLQKYL